MRSIRAIISFGLSSIALASFAAPKPGELGTVEKREVRSAGFSPDGRTILTYSLGQGVTSLLTAWDTASKQELYSINEPADYYIKYAFSPDGKTFLMKGKSIQLRETSTGREIGAWSNQKLRSFAFSPDSKTVLVEMIDYTIRLLEADSGKEITNWGVHDHDTDLFSIVFSPDGKIALSVSRKYPLDNSEFKYTFKSWDVASGKVINAWRSNGFSAATPVFQPDGKAVFLVFSSTLRDSASLMEIWTNGDIQDNAAFLPDGKTLVTNTFKGAYLRFLNVADGKELVTFQLPGNLVAFSPDGKTALLAMSEGERDPRLGTISRLLKTTLFLYTIPSRQDAETKSQKEAMAQTQPRLRSAIQSRNVGEINTLLDMGVDLNASKPYEQTALVLAVSQGSEEIVKILLSHGANLNPRPRHDSGRISMENFLPLSAAAYHEKSSLIKLFIAAGSDVDKAIEELETHADTMEGLNSTYASLCRLGAERLKHAARRDLPSSQVAVVKTAEKGAVESHDKKTTELTVKHSDVDVPKYKRSENPDNFAVVVGIENYADLPEAAHAERDAQAVRDHLLALGFPSKNVVLLTGQRATKTGLVKNLEAWLPNNVNERSTVFFFYSGHGAPDVKSKQAYLVPIDGDPNYLNETAYPIRVLYDRLGALKAKQVIVALDSCFSGAGGRSVLAKGTRPLVTIADMGSVAGKIVSLSASRADQISGTHEDEGHGLFTYYLLRGLNGAAKDDAGSITVQSLYEYVAPNVQDHARRQNREQVPQFLHGAGDVAIITLR